MSAAPLADPENALRFIYAGNARVTLVSRMTGARYTYRVRALPPTKWDSERREYVEVDGPPSTWLVQLLVGSDNNSSYKPLGLSNDTTLLVPTQNSRYSVESKPFRAFKYAIGNLRRGEIPEDLEIWHEGRCGKCNRALTVPESIATGFGPECSRSLAA
jgi:hypothetical protein